MNRVYPVLFCLGLLVGAGVTYGLVLSHPARQDSVTATLAPSNQASTVEAYVILQAPFRGPSVSITASSSVGGKVSGPFLETLLAEYAPTGNGTTAKFTDYYGEFVAAVANLTVNANVTLEVSYGQLSATGMAGVSPVGGTAVIPLILGTPALAPLENMTSSNGASDCRSLGGIWDIVDATCTLDGPTLAPSLTVGKGVTLVNDGYLDGVIDNRGGAIVNEPGSIIDNTQGKIDNKGGYLNNSGVIDNSYGTITNDGGTIVNSGKIIADEGSSGITNIDGSITNTGTIQSMGGSIENGGGVIINRGGTLKNIMNYLNNTGGTIDNSRGGRIVNSGILFNSHGVIYNTYEGVIENTPLGDPLCATPQSVDPSAPKCNAVIDNSGGTIDSSHGGTIYNIQGGTIIDWTAINFGDGGIYVGPKCSVDSIQC